MPEIQVAERTERVPRETMEKMKVGDWFIEGPNLEKSLREKAYNLKRYWGKKFVVSTEADGRIKVTRTA